MGNVLLSVQTVSDDALVDLDANLSDGKVLENTETKALPFSETTLLQGMTAYLAHADCLVMSVRLGCVKKFV